LRPLDEPHRSWVTQIFVIADKQMHRWTASRCHLKIFVVERGTIRFQVLYVFLVLAHDRRHVLHFGVTDHPTAEWTVQQLREAFPWETAPRYLLRDRDRIFGADFVQQVEAMGIKQVLSAPRSPWQRAYVERVIGTIRRECVDHVIVLRRPACLATSEDSRTIIIGVVRTWACRRTPPSHAPSKHQKPGGSSRSQRWVGYIIVTNVAPTERRRVEPPQ
jgi:transposase InsO family protein